MTTVPLKYCRRRLHLRLSFVIGKPTALQRPKELVYWWSWRRWPKYHSTEHPNQSFWSACKHTASTFSFWFNCT